MLQRLSEVLTKPVVGPSDPSFAHHPAGGHTSKEEVSTAKLQPAATTLQHVNRAELYQHHTCSVFWDNSLWKQGQEGVSLWGASPAGDGRGGTMSGFAEQESKKR